jgi:hypothetical protein
MEEYRAYFVGHDGHFNGFEPIVCAHDAAAIDKAKRLVNRHSIEIWSGARLVGRLEPVWKQRQSSRLEPVRKQRQSSSHDLH